MNNTPREAAEDVFFLRTLFVNVFIVRTGTSWVLVDAGLGGYADSIRAAAREVVGGNTAPSSVVLTHGHFDHVGSIEPLLRDWNCPVYAHTLERPYLAGRSPYPPPDLLVGRGSMALLSRLYPRGPIDISVHLEALPQNGTIPGLPDWNWIHTPGHTSGHVSLFRERDRTLIAGDAVTTTKQESLVAVATQRRELHGPPSYFTPDWDSAARSVQRIAALDPEVLASGHGEPMRGAEMRAGLRELAADFDKREVPSMGRYAGHPAITNEDGIISLPPDPLPKVVAGLVVAAGLTYAMSRSRSRVRA
jgi:glyoxylase-like metal-dependent hydrolase (beta-lactamase superfamily II)